MSRYPSGPYRRVVVVGLDGLDPTLVRRFMARGLLPHLSGLATRGSFSALRTTLPAQTPTAWSTFATGLNPGGHGIYDFLRRDPTSYRVDLALSRTERRNRLLPPRMVNLRGGRTIWERLGDAGHSSTILRCPATFPPDKMKGRVLAGVGVPDLRGGIGTATLLAAEEVGPEHGEIVVRLRGDGGSWRAHLDIPWFTGTARAEVELTVDGERGRIGLGGAVADVHQGSWSEWTQIRFSVGLPGSIRGLVRARAIRLGEAPLVYLSPINLDPTEPAFPISHPWGFAGELARKLGDFGTLGMLEDHGGFSNGRFDGDAFLDQCRLTFDERERMLFEALGRSGDSLVFCVFDTPDRIQHMFWREGERGEGSQPGSGRTQPFRDVIATHYAQCDALVGRVLGAVDEDTLVLVVSDHGFGAFARAVELNRWLATSGYLTLASGVDPEDPATDFLGGIDWGRTRAYSLGFGSLYLNRMGREGSGIVQDSECDALAAELAARLTTLEDQGARRQPVIGVVRREEVYHGPRVHEAPDLVVKFNAGYRAGWRSAAGGVGVGPVVVENTRRWSGDHIVAPELVPGVLFANRPLRRGEPWLADCAPTILTALLGPAAGVYGVGLEGHSLLR